MPRPGTPHRRERCSCAVAVLALFVGVLGPPLHARTSESVPGPETPKLILQITVDQLRGDLPLRFRHRFGRGGLRRLLDGGLHYANAHYRHANTETIVGHTTLATGAYPALHGMVGNVWFDYADGRLVYNIEDPRYPLLTVGAGVDRTTEIDPTQRTATSQGRSPSAILVSTFGDELALASAGKAKVFAVSVKDRGAVSMAGHAGVAYWFSKATGEFVTSSFYAERYPVWVEEWNRERRPRRYAGTSWELLGEVSTYLYGDADDRPWETDFPGWGRTFPHPYGSADGKYFTTLLTLSPAGDELTAEFARALIENEGLGQDEVTDFLGVSFSSTDYVGHLFGPGSLEAEDNLLRLDRTLAGLLAFVDERVGLAHTLVVLSADHGGPDVPGALRELGMDSDYVDPSSWPTAPGIEALERRFGVGEGLIEEFFPPYLYLDRDLIAEHRLDQGEVEGAVAAELQKLDGIALAISTTALREGRVGSTPIVEAVRKNDHPGRSGDIYVVFEPQRFINDFDGLTVAATHGSPWSYDTYVPILLAGPGIPARTVYRSVAPNDIAPTLAAVVGIKAPSGSAGEILLEVMEGRR